MFILLSENSDKHGGLFYQQVGTFPCLNHVTSFLSFLADIVTGIVIVCYRNSDIYIYIYITVTTR